MCSCVAIIHEVANLPPKTSVANPLSLGTEEDTDPTVF